MNFKDKWRQLSINKKTVLYWLTVILLIDVSVAIPKIFQFLQTGHCRNYMVLNSPAHICTFSEFAQYGHGWMTFANLFALLPAAAIMIFLTNIVDIIFVKKDR